MSLIVNLPWYDYPASAKSLDFFWGVLRQQLVLLGFQCLPTALARGGSLAKQWRDPNLLLSQCCGPDLFTQSTSAVKCLGRPVFSDLECAAGYYYSHIVSLGRPSVNPRIAINSPTSWSGNNSLQHWLAENACESSSCIVSGSHQQSLNLLRLGKVDLIAVDAHSWNLLDTEGAVIIDRGPVAPTPPYISNLSHEATRQLLSTAIAQCLTKHGDSLGISEMLPADRRTYANLNAASRIQLEVAESN